MEDKGTRKVEKQKGMKNCKECGLELYSSGNKVHICQEDRNAI